MKWGKLMKIIITLAVTSILFGCATGSFPGFPGKVKNQYTVDIRDQILPEALEIAIVNIDDIPPMPEDKIVRCLKFDIVSQFPYKIKYIGQAELSICNGVTGFLPEDAISVYNWMDDVGKWAEKRKKCFK